MAQSELETSRRAKARMVLEAPIADVPSVGQWPVVLQTLDIQPSVQSLPANVSDSLLHKYSTTSERIARANLGVRFLGYAPVFQGTRIYPGETSDWALMNLADDPLYVAHNQKLIIPPTVLQDLKNVKQAGINFDALFIAHEIASGSVQPGRDVPLEMLIPPPPPNVMRTANAANSGVQILWHGIESLVKAALTMTAASIAVAGTLTAGVFASASFDPIIFGLYLDPNQLEHSQPVAMWYYLTHWYWPATE